MEIIPLGKEHRKSLIALYRAVTAVLKRQGNDQWDRWIYPNRFTIGGDIRKGTVYGIVDQGRVVGAIAMDKDIREATASYPWTGRKDEAWSIHRLAVHPERQGQGLGGRLLRFGEDRIRASGGTSIRLEVYAANPGAIGMYERAGYGRVGETRYPMRKHPYFCYEKLLHEETSPSDT
ncbi:GNAT family N-acetyltransferase [Cohnella caldifontis]|uniref:GNAT family N-acetyltransferase n=1 Tax=Cohnella caldifontis TaxID=3027471 RepID=UPI0023EA8763|nr:GNAT family N-acetyltransferase [Cohnella sp. YIM B05605]